MKLKIKKCKRRKPLEKTPEGGATRKMREQGALVCKLRMLGQNSWPDRLVIPEGVKVKVFVCRTAQEAMDAFECVKTEPFMIEYKRDDGSDCTELQEALHAQLRSGQRP